MKTVNFFLLVSFLGLLVGFASCGGTNDNGLSCLDCNVIGFPICEGDTDPDTGGRLSKRDLQVSKNLFEKNFGLDCTLE